MPGNSSKHIILCGHMVIIAVAQLRISYHRSSNNIIKCLIVHSYLMSGNSSKHIILCGGLMVDQSYIIKCLREHSNIISLKFCLSCPPYLTHLSLLGQPPPLFITVYHTRRIALRHILCVFYGFLCVFSISLHKAQIFGLI